jgi:uncharacterized coiled-coil protein SlyX
MQRLRAELEVCAAQNERLRVVLAERKKELVESWQTIERLQAELAATQAREKTYAESWDAAGRLPPSRFAADE